MAMVVILFLDGEPLSLGSGTTRRLAELGVTTLAMLDDGEGSCLVLDGWSFDGPQLVEEAVDVVAGSRPVRLLRPHVQMAVLPTT